MSEKMDYSEKDKSKIIKKVFREETSEHDLTTQFINKVKSGEIKTGERLVEYDKAIEFCRKKGIDGNEFKKILCYAIKGVGANQQSIGNWFEESKDMGNNIRYFVTKYYDSFMEGKSYNA